MQNFANCDIVIKVVLNGSWASVQKPKSHCRWLLVGNESSQPLDGFLFLFYLFHWWFLSFYHLCFLSILIIDYIISTWGYAYLNKPAVYSAVPRHIFILLNQYGHPKIEPKYLKTSPIFLNSNQFNNCSFFLPNDFITLFSCLALKSS